MNILVSNRRAERGGRNFSVPVVRGEPREKDLPRPGNQKPKILRKFVCAEWLADHQQQDTPTRICWLNQSDQNIQDQDDSNEGLEDQARNLPVGTNGKLFRYHPRLDLTHICYKTQTLTVRANHTHKLTLTL
jgi:hypothetical protein